MEILHVLHTFPPFSRAGSENYTQALATQQAALGHRAHIFHRVNQTERPEYEVSEAEFEGLEVARINRAFQDAASFADSYRSDRVAEAFGAHLDESQPDLVHFHHVTALSTTCVAEAKRRGLPVVYTLHDLWLLCPRGQYLRRDLTLCDRHTAADCVRCMAYALPIAGGHERVERLWARARRLRRWRLPANWHRRLASLPFEKEEAAVAEIRRRTLDVRAMCDQVDHFVSPSRFLRDHYVAFGVPADRITVSDYGFDLSYWQDYERPHAPPSAPLRVAYLGTWIPSKGVHVLVEAFRKIDPAQATLDIHGYAPPFDGFADYGGHLRRLAGDAPQIRFRERYEPAEVPRLLAAADVLAVPSIWYENSPLTIHEAFLAGVPVIATGHGGMKELVEDGRSGLLFRPGSTASLRRAILRLASDRALLARLRSGIPRVKSIEENAEELLELYRDLLGRRQVARPARP